MNVVGIDHVQLAIPPGGEPEARRLSGEVLGFGEVPKPAPMAVRGGMWFQAGPVGIPLGIEPGLKAPGRAHPAHVVADLDAFVARLVAAGARWTPSDEIPNTRRGHTWDPFGNRIELVEVAR